MGFEVIVRPVVLPNIRPTTARVLAKSDNPESGMAVLSGGGGKFIGLSTSTSFSTSQSSPHQEKKRQVDVHRVYQMDKGGTIEKENFIDVQMLKKIRTDTSKEVFNVTYATPKVEKNVEVLESNKTIISPDGA